MIDVMIERPVLPARQVVERLGCTHRAVQRAIDQVLEGGILREITGQQRNRIFVADEVLAIVSPVTRGG